MKLAAALLCFLLCGCSTVRIQDEARGVVFVARVPAWPWQDSMRVIEKMNLSARGTNFTASIRGMTETETANTNVTAMIEAVVRAAVSAAAGVR